MSIRSGEGTAFEVYYFLTPVFWLMDVLLEAPIRAAAIESTPGRWTYYVLLVGIGVVCHLRPGWSAFLGLLEGSGNLLLLILSILLPIWNAAVELPAGGDVIGMTQLANFALVAPMTVLAIKRAEWGLVAGASGHRS